MLSGVLVVATICVEESVEVSTRAMAAYHVLAVQGRGGAVSTWLALVVAEFCSTCFLSYKLWSVHQCCCFSHSVDWCDAGTLIGRPKQSRPFIGKSSS
jgi:hypothetical protein